MSVTFSVDPVEPASLLADTVPLEALVGPHLALGLPLDLPVIAERDTHPLLAAVHFAFVGHRPLLLSPDAIWLTIASGFAHHVQIHSEALRPRLVRHTGRRLLEIQALTEPTTPEDWATIVHAFRGAIAEDLGQGVARLLTCDFSTTTLADRCASEIVLMDAVASYYDFLVTIVCGIPEITLTGTPDDWRKIRERLDILSEFDLGFWTASLVPICDRLVDAAKGSPDESFFQRIYKPRESYGWDRITGWIARLYPYVQGASGKYDERNPLLEHPIDHVFPKPEDHMDFTGIRSQDVPSGPSRVPVKMHTQDGAQRSLCFEGGLLVVEQDAQGRLSPRAGFVIRDDAGGQDFLIEQLRQEHDASPGAPDDGALWVHDGALNEFFERVGSADLKVGDQVWRLLEAEARETIQLAVSRWGQIDAIRLIDLPDGQCIGLVSERNESYVVLLQTDLFGTTFERTGNRSERFMTGKHPRLGVYRVRRTAQRPGAIPVLGHSFLTLLKYALDLDELPKAQSMLIDSLPSWLDSGDHAAPLIERLKSGPHKLQLHTHDSYTPEGLKESVNLVNLPLDLCDTIADSQLYIGKTTWSMLPDAGRQRVSILLGSERSSYGWKWVDISDGSFLAKMHSSKGKCIARIRSEEILVEGQGRRRGLEIKQPPEQIEVLGRSLVEVLEQALGLGAVPPAQQSFLQWYEAVHKQ